MKKLKEAIKEELPLLVFILAVPVLFMGLSQFFRLLFGG